MKTYSGKLILSVLGNDLTVPFIITDQELKTDAAITITVEYLGQKYKGVGKSLE